MKFLSSLSLLLGVVAALQLEERQQPHKKAARRPAQDQVGFVLGTAHPTKELSTESLLKVPSSVTDSHHVARQLSPSSFYECPAANPAPTDADCTAILDAVYGLGNQSLTVAAGACLTFVFNTCTGFFCSLCATLSATTDFVADQLDTAEFLCVADGRNGVVVGDEAPQWQAGLIRSGGPLPYYDVC